jgi:hypothetical protein
MKNNSNIQLNQVSIMTSIVPTVTPIPSSEQQQHQPIIQLHHDLIASFIGGSAGIFVGQPLDLIKSQLQQAPDAQFSINSLRKTIFQTEGSLFRGVGPPLVGGALYTCTTFVSYRRFLNAIDHLTGNNNNNNKHHHDTSFIRHFSAGTCSGWLSTLLTTPFEMTKLKLQLDDKSGGGTRGAMTREFLRLYRVDGIRALYTGWSAMLIRDGPGSGMYFGVYHTLKNRNKNTENLMMIEFISGGIAGVICWLSVLPFDVAKTRISMESYTHDQPNKKPQQLVPVLRTILKEEGPRALMSGWFPISIRAFVVNSTTFWVYERCLEGIC